VLVMILNAEKAGDNIRIMAKRESTKTSKRVRNPLAVLYSIIALIFMVLTFTVYWMFIALAAFFSWLGWRALFK
jgi:nitrogen fixation/metabolism regulation signal transduction histidine kinase